MSQFMNFPIAGLLLISNLSPFLHQSSPLKADPPDLAVLDVRWKKIREENWPAWDRPGESYDSGWRRTTYRNKYEMRVKNTGGKVIRAVYWKYVFSHSESGYSGEYDTGFWSKVRIKPEETKVLKGESCPGGPPKITDRVGRQIQISEMKQEVKIICIEYEDGSIWTQHQ
jgi:hypothetical protein